MVKQIFKKLQMNLDLLLKNIVYTEFPMSSKVHSEISSKGYKAVYKDAPMFYGGVQALVK